MSDTNDKLVETMFELGDLVLEKISENLKKDPFDQQKIYEKWIKQDEWKLRDQGLPLAIGLDPEKWSELFDLSGFKELEQTAWDALEKLSPTEEGPNILNIDDETGEWKVNSTEFYRWLNSKGITVPDSLDSLMQFVMTVILKPKEDTASEPANVVAGSGTSDREKVLGAAFNIVSKEPNSCRDDSGLTNGKALAEMIAAQSVLWFEKSKPPMSVEKMGDFLEKWLE